MWVNRANSMLPVQDGNDICLSGGWDMNGDALYSRVAHDAPISGASGARDG